MFRKTVLSENLFCETSEMDLAQHQGGRYVWVFTLIDTGKILQILLQDLFNFLIMKMKDYLSLLAYGVVNVK
jgi:hypothetical protein